MAKNGYLLGFDVGSSSVKASLLDAETGKLVSSATSPKTELTISAKQPGWAEQDPEVWWEHVQRSAAQIRAEVGAKFTDVAAIGISYQMHGLVLVDKNGKVLRPSIIWCDSRAVPYGNRAFEELGADVCLNRLCNSPGNFTASKLAWVKENEPELYGNVYKFMLPGDFIAFRLTGEITTTPSGLSEGIMWEMRQNRPADFLMEHFGFEKEILPEVKPTFAVHGKVSREASALLGIREGTPVSYRAGDQPNNAFSLNVLRPGELAATAGTSGVVYGIVDHPAFDPKSRVNTFVHVNHAENERRYGVLLCLNGTGILNRWLKQNCVDSDGREVPYADLNAMAADVPPGAEGVLVFPYGNGAERTLENRDPGAQFLGINFNIHDRKHLLRAGQEGIVFALAYGLDIMRKMDMKIETVKAGYANMFLSPLFRNVFATVTGTSVELYSTDGSQGAARGAGVGAGIYGTVDEAFIGLEAREKVEPDAANAEAYREAYGRWLDALKNRILK